MLILESSSEIAAGWEVAKNVMVTLSTGGVLWMCKTLFDLRDDVRDLKHGWKGEDGTNGAKSQIADHERRLRLIERRHDEIDAVAEAVERAQYDGPERRRESRRLRDKLNDSARESES